MGHHSSSLWSLPTFPGKVAFLATVGIWTCSLCSIRHNSGRTGSICEMKEYIFLWGCSIKWKKVSKRGALIHCQSCPATLGQGRRGLMKDEHRRKWRQLQKAWQGRGARQISEVCLVDLKNKNAMNVYNLPWACFRRLPSLLPPSTPLNPVLFSIPERHHPWCPFKLQRKQNIAYNLEANYTWFHF